MLNFACKDNDENVQTGRIFFVSPDGNISNAAVLLARRQSHLPRKLTFLQTSSIYIFPCDEKKEILKKKKNDSLLNRVRTWELLRFS